MGKIFEAMEKFRKQNGKREHSEIICSVKDKKENKTEKEPHNKEDIKETDISPKIKKSMKKNFFGRWKIYLQPSWIHPSLHI